MLVARARKATVQVRSGPDGLAGDAVPYSQNRERSQSCAQCTSQSTVCDSGSDPEAMFAD